MNSVNADLYRSTGRRFLKASRACHGTRAASPAFSQALHRPELLYRSTTPRSRLYSITRDNVSLSRISESNKRLDSSEDQENEIGARHVDKADGTQTPPSPQGDISESLRLKSLHRISTPILSYWSEQLWVDGDIPSTVNVRKRAEFMDYLTQNSTKMQLIFLGTSGWRPKVKRALPCMAMRTASDIWIFDAGEDAQRQCLKHPLVRPGKISRVFLTSLDGDCLFGLAGLLCGITTSRYRGKANSNQPVHIYGPLGTGEFFARMMKYSDTYLEAPVIVHEFTREPSSMETMRISKRAKVWKVNLPPDGLNERGGYDAHLDAVRPLRRKTDKPGRHMNRRNTVDERAGFRPFPKAPIGDPARYPLPSDELEWTLFISDEFRIKVYLVQQDGRRLAYRVEEATRSGSLDVERAKSLGVKPGKKYGILKNGGSVENDKGETITSAMVLTPSLPGRVFTIVGDIHAPHAPLRAAANADYLMLAVGKGPQNARGLSPQEAIQFAKNSAVKRLVFSRLNALDGEISESVERCLADESISVTAAFDLYTHVVPSVVHCL